ncbi:MAG: HD-GYP domain-containing protein [Actinomycetota bacterium]|nr:HD-GYP domain-containing protein [Actinomycetota bacterium]
MKKVLKELKANYISAVKNYIVNQDEAALEQAYELGRHAIENRLGILDVAAIHEEALALLLKEAPSPEAGCRTSLVAERFFTEVLAPYDMTQRGFAEANIELSDLNKTLESHVLTRTRELRSTLDKLRQVMDGTIRTIALIGAIRDPYTTGHEERVAELAVAIAKDMGLPELLIDGLRVAALLHDVGKIAIPTEILSKPGRITAFELDIIREHPEVGYSILKSIDFPWPVADIILQSHERIDGSGYPKGLKGDKLLLEARILVVADVVEAMASHRPYRPALGVKAALKELTDQKGSLYDPDVVDACLKLFQKKGFKFKPAKAAIWEAA